MSMMLHLNPRKLFKTHVTVEQIIYSLKLFWWLLSLLIYKLVNIFVSNKTQNPPEIIESKSSVSNTPFENTIPEKLYTHANAPSFIISLSQEEQWVDGDDLRKRKAISEQGREPSWKILRTSSKVSLSYNANEKSPKCPVPPKSEKTSLGRGKNQDVKQVNSLFGCAIVDKNVDGSIGENCQRIRNDNTLKEKVRSMAVRTKYLSQSYEKIQEDVNLYVVERGSVATILLYPIMNTSPKSRKPEITLNRKRYTSRPPYLTGSDNKRKKKMFTPKNKGIATNKRWVNADLSRQIKSKENASIGEDSSKKDNQMKEESAGVKGSSIAK